jgi:hypothetical protein
MKGGRRRTSSVSVAVRWRGSSHSPWQNRGSAPMKVGASVYIQPMPSALCVGVWGCGRGQWMRKEQRKNVFVAPTRRPFNSTSRTPFRHSARPVAFYHGFQHGAFHTIHNTRGARRNTQCSELRRSAVRVSPRRRRRRRRLAPGRITDGLDTDARGTYGKSV